MTTDVRRHLTAKHSANREPITPWYVVIHDTEGAMPGVLGWLADTPSPPATVSVHYLITKAGIVYQIGLDTWCTWHAGRTYWADRAPGVGVSDSGNRDMIGIELEHVTANQGTAYPAAQLAALDTLIDHLFAHNPTLKGVVGHKDIAYPRGRKSDPQLNVHNYSISAVRARLKGEEEDDMTEKDREMLAYAAMWALEAKLDAARAVAVAEGRLEDAAKLKDQRPRDIKYWRERWGVV